MDQTSQGGGGFDWASLVGSLGGKGGGAAGAGPSSASQSSNNFGLNLGPNGGIILAAGAALVLIVFAVLLLRK